MRTRCTCSTCFGPWKDLENFGVCGSSSRCKSLPPVSWPTSFACQVVCQPVSISLVGRDKSIWVNFYLVSASERITVLARSDLPNHPTQGSLAQALFSLQTILYPSASHQPSNTLWGRLLLRVSWRLVSSLWGGLSPSRRWVMLSQINPLANDWF